MAPSTITRPTRSRWQFSLRSLFVATLLLAIILGYHANWIRKRHTFLAREMETTEQTYRAFLPKFGWDRNPATNTGPPGLLWLFGATGYARLPLVVDGEDLDSVSERDRRRIREAQSLFPEAHITLHYFAPDGDSLHVWGVP
jgi:hypothetical protein